MTHQEKLTKLRQLRQQLAEVEETLGERLASLATLTADSPSVRWAAGQEYDLITAFIDDLQTPTY